MIAWEPDGIDAASALLSLALALGATELLVHGLPSWWPAPIGIAALALIIGVLALGVALARRPK